MVNVKAVENVTHEGKSYAPGEIVEVDEFLGEWLVSVGSATYECATATFGSAVQDPQSDAPSNKGNTNSQKEN